MLLFIILSPYDTHAHTKTNLPINGACETALSELTSDAMLFTSDSVSNGI